ncbi:hypothetical protein Moror_328, partial [Moniliophthora roreri MCA 2997]
SPPSRDAKVSRIARVLKCVLGASSLRHGIVYRLSKVCQFLKPSALPVFKAQALPVYAVARNPSGIKRV